MCHAFAERLPGVVLAHAHAEHVGFASIWVETFVLEGLEGVEVRLELGPCYVRAVFEEDDVRYWGARGHFAKVALEDFVD